MDDAAVRPAYPRRSLPNKKRKKYNKDNGGTLVILKRQLALCLLLLLIAGLIKGIDTPVTNFFKEKVRYILEKDIEINSIFSEIDRFVNNIKDYRLFAPEKNGSKLDEIPSNTESYIPEDNDEEKIDYGGPVEGEENQVYKVGSGTEIQEQENENDGAVDNQAETYSFIAPVSGVLSSPFGERIHPVEGGEKFHKGIDIKADNGDPIKAASDGEVIEADKEATYGNFIEIRHKDDLITVYAHCSVLIAKKGQKVKKGDIIARVGSTGESTGPHLHFEVHKNGTPVDPLKYVKIPEK